MAKQQKSWNALLQTAHHSPSIPALSLPPSTFSAPPPMFLLFAPSRRRRALVLIMEMLYPLLCACVYSRLNVINMLDIQGFCFLEVPVHHKDGLSWAEGSFEINTDSLNPFPSVEITARQSSHYQIPLTADTYTHTLTCAPSMHAQPNDPLSLQTSHTVQHLSRADVLLIKLVKQQTCSSFCP